VRRPRPWRRRPAERQNARRWSRFFWTFWFPRDIEQGMARAFQGEMDRMLNRLVRGTSSVERPRRILSCSDEEIRKEIAR
jgi:hypothetical protein